MKKMLLLVVMLVMVLSVFAETVILNDGRNLKGEIVGKKGDSIYLSSGGSIHLLTRDLVKQIKNDGDLTITKLTYKKKDFMNEGIETAKLTPLSVRENVNYNEILYPIDQAAMQPKYETKVNYHTIIFGVAFAGLAWDYFSTAGEFGDLIKDYEENNYPKKEIDKLKKQKTRKLINGSLFSIASAASFVVSFESIEIKATPTSIEVGYKF